ncbi:MAG: peptidoglycan-associated lipoprotein Pal [Acidobacteria bacterium]|nr:MAG: peptidoglycan-associated lipoprotein Pal [Acidobacteriota bacterium]
MRIRSVARVVLYGVIALAIVGVGCKHPAPVTPAVAPAPPPPPPPQPTVTLQATPANVQRGQATTLRWSSTNATSLTLAPGVGNVSPEGNTSVTPTDSVTYTISATGPGGSASATARVTVTVPPPPPVAVAPAPSLEELFAKEVKDAYFDFDKADIRPDARSALAETAGFLKSYPQVKVMIEGHCDERGSTEYNLALGDRRAQATKDFLVSLGVASDRMQTVSYGKERPFCNEHVEDCWQQNRRGHFLMAK